MDIIVGRDIVSCYKIYVIYLQLTDIYLCNVIM